MLRKDKSVELKLHAVLTNLLFDIDELYREWGSELVITSGSEKTARHSLTSLHYADPACAVDIRVWEVANVPTPEQQLKSIKKVSKLYCSTYSIPDNWIEVILESDHIHIEYQPKRI